MQALIPFPDISPEIFSITAFGIEFALRWYALAYIVGILVAWRISHRAIRRADLWKDQRVPLNTAQLEDLLFWVIIGILVGGRLGYVLFYKPGYFLRHPDEILMLWQGGMSFHGGFIGVILAGMAFCWRHRLPVLSVGDAVSLGAPVGLLLGRVANFVNAELWGRPTDLPWGVAFPGPSAQACPGIETICARHPSQLYEAVLEGIVLLALMLWLAWRRGALHVPGQMIGIFLIGYGVARFIVEYFRQADDQFITTANPMGYVIRLGELGLSMGQVLSLPMIMFGCLMLLIVRRRTQ